MLTMVSGSVLTILRAFTKASTCVMRVCSWASFDSLSCTRPPLLRCTSASRSAPRAFS